MINWLSVVANSFWVVGLAVILAALSYYYWLADQLGHSLREEFGRPRFQRLLVLGLLLVGIGLALTSNDLWQILPAAVLIIGCVVALFALRRQRHRQRSDG
jgi:hypothetical protein